MRIELVANLIEAMEFGQFREFARQCILQKGYKATPTDGWSDGGRDIRVYTAEGRVSRNIAFQTSVEWDWKEKLWEDLIKAKNTLGCDDFIYVTNRRIAEAVFDPIAQQALTDEGVHLNKIDKQDLSAHVIDTDRLGWFTQFLGLPQANVDGTATSLRTEVSDAFVLFSDEAEDFRDRIAEHAIMVGLLRRGPMKRPGLIAAAADIIDFNDQNRLEASLDRLQQSGEVLNVNETFSLSKERSEHYDATQALVDADRRAYRDALKACLAEFVKPSKIDDVFVRVEELLGKLVRRYSDYQVALLQESQDANDIRQSYGAQVRELEAAMHESGVPLDQVRACIERINEVAKDHPVVTRLAAGDVFTRLLPCERSALLNALGRVKGVQVFLEPTVIIPLLCTKLYKTAAGNRQLRAANWLFERAAALRVAFLVPDIYIEECAVHLIHAGRFINLMYQVDVREFAYSDNAFVAFYASLIAEHKPAAQFKEFLEVFGFVPVGEFKEQLDQVQAKLRRLLRTYNVTVANVRTYRPDSLIRQVAEKDLSFIYNQQSIEKPAVLARHDIQVLAYIRDKANKGGDARLLATWDNTLQCVCRMDEYDWWCLDPLHAGDLMSLVEPSGRGAMGVDVALLLDDAHLQLASKIWDTIVRIEKDNMFDAKLIAQAVKFRKEFLARQTSDTVAASLIAKSWKETRTPKGESTDLESETATGTKAR